MDKNLCLLKYNSCFGTHGQLSVLLRNVKYYFEIKPKNNAVAEGVLQVVLCNIKHLIDLCNIKAQNISLPSILAIEKNSWQYYSDLKAPTKIKQIYLEIALSEYLLIENYKKLLSSGDEKNSGCFEKLIMESEQCLTAFKKQIEKT